MKKNDKIMGTRDPDLTQLVFKSLQEGLMTKTPWSSLHQRQDPKGDGRNGNRGPEAGTGLQKSHLRSGGHGPCSPSDLWPGATLLAGNSFSTLPQQFESGILLQFNPDYIFPWSQKIVARAVF